MKKITTLLALILFCQLAIVNAIAQAPNSLPYQAIARNSAAVIIANQNISLRFQIHDLTAIGTVAYSETQSVTTNALGLFSCNIGTGTVQSGSFAGIGWSSGNKFMQVEMDVTGGTAYLDMGTTQLMSVPYALQANMANAANTATSATTLTGALGQSSTTFTSSSIIVFPGDMGDHLFYQSVTAPDNSTVLISTEGGFTPQFSNYTVLDIELSIDNIMVSKQKIATTAPNTGNWNITKSLILTPGSHTVLVMLRNVSTNSGWVIAGGDLDSGTQGSLTITALRN